MWHTVFSSYEPEHFETKSVRYVLTKLKRDEKKQMRKETFRIFFIFRIDNDNDNDTVDKKNK